MLYPLSYEGRGLVRVFAGQTLHSGSPVPRALRRRAPRVPNRSVSNGLLKFGSSSLWLWCRIAKTLVTAV